MRAEEPPRRQGMDKVHTPLAGQQVTFLLP
jgi:hypothetical protein